MIIVDLHELEERAHMAAESIGGVVLEPEAVLIIISEIRRMKSQLGEQQDHLTGMRGELMELRTEIVDALTRGPALKGAATTPKKGKMLKMKIVDNKKHGGAKK